MNRSSYKFLITSVILMACLPQTAAAYIGPGTGMSAIGAFLALVVGVVVAILGFLWYPIKRILAGKKKTAEPSQAEDKED